jgi:hypothetical protein
VIAGLDGDEIDLPRLPITVRMTTNMKKSSPLDEIVGQTVTDAKRVHDYIQLGFGEKIGLSVYNDIHMLPAGASIDDLTGKMVISVDEKQDSVEIRFLDKTAFIIDMRDQAFHGPEAIQLNRVGQTPVIWRSDD